MLNAFKTVTVVLIIVFKIFTRNILANVKMIHFATPINIVTREIRIPGLVNGQILTYQAGLKLGMVNVETPAIYLLFIPVIPNYH